MKKHLSQWVILLLALAAIAGVYFYVTNAIDAQKNRVQKPRPAPPEQAVSLSVVPVTSGRYAATVTASGLVSPRYAVTMTSQVSGEIVRLSEQFEVGQVVKKGQVLAQLQNSELSSAVANAKHTVATAELALKEEIRQGEQAKAEWAAAGFSGEPDSDLVLRAPQLAAAKTSVDAAKAALANAQTKLQYSTLIAPFDALVVERHVSPGAYLNNGNEVATLYSTDRADITVDLSQSDWSKLPDTDTLLQNNWPVRIASIDTNDQWPGKVLRINQHIDATTRMRSLIISLEKPLEQTPALVPGAFVTVSIQGKPLDNLWRLPNTALSQKSEIWYVDDNSRLAAFEVTPRFVDAQHIYIQVPDAMRNETYQVLVQPYSSYLKGTLVNPIKIADVNKVTTP